MTNQSLINRAFRKSIRMGIPPKWFNYRWIEKETVHQYLDRKQNSKLNESYKTIHETEVVKNPLPCNIEDRDDLPRDRGWWGYSFRDVPNRTSGDTFMATLPDCKVIPCLNPEDDQFWVSILNSDDRSLELDQISYRSWHGDVLRSSSGFDKTAEATWFLERVYRNHSHWITSHLPKLILLKERNELENIVLPPKHLRTPVINSSLEMMGINPEEFRTFDESRPLQVKKLTVLENDRFRPELLKSVRKAFCIGNPAPSHRRIYISREKAERRKLVNGDKVWSCLEKMGFEKIYMEDLSFSDQILLMQQASVVVAPHGAAITNVIFCQPGTHVVEIADLSFPNPNFYALSSAMGHHYWILDAEGIGDVHPLKKDLYIDPSEVKNTVLKIYDY